MLTRLPDKTRYSRSVVGAAPTQLLTALSIVCVLGLSTFRIVAAEPVVTEIGPNHKTFQRVEQERLSNGKMRNRVSGYTEMAAGLHYLNPQGEWAASQDIIEILQDVAVARQGQVQVTWAANLATAGSVDITLHGGQRLRTHVLGLAFHDFATGQSELVAEVKDCAGELHPPNEVHYPDAFTDVKATVRYTYTRGRFDQDVILFQRLSLPQGFNPASTKLEIWTELLSPPAPVKSIQRVGNQDDETLDWGAARMGLGRAFELEDPQGLAWSVPMAKQLVNVENRTFLVESVEFPAVQPAMNRLPRPPQGAGLRAPNNPRRQMARNAGGQRFFPARAQTAKAGGKLKVFQTASTSSPAVLNPLLLAQGNNNKGETLPAINASRGLVLDYSLVVSMTNITFAGDTTYFMAGDCTLSGTNILESGAVIKSTNNANLIIAGFLECRTDAYRPAILTSWCDNTVGDTISGSTGNPSTNLAGNALNMSSSATLSQLKHLRIAYHTGALAFNTGRGHQAQHIQIVHCTTALIQYAATCDFRNLLVYNSATLFNTVTPSTSRVEHATLDIVGTMNLSGNCVLFYTNCLLVAVTNTGTYTGANNASNSDPAAVFQTVGAGGHYLLNNTYRNLGTTNINSVLLSEIRQRTTYAPVLLDNKIAVDLTLSPQVQRDTDLLDLGWHYDPIDFAMRSAWLGTNISLTILPGTSISVCGPTSGSGLLVYGGCRLDSRGTPTQPVRFVRHTLVQEQANTNWAGLGASILPILWAGLPAPQLKFRFTEFAVPAVDVEHFAGIYTDGLIAFTDCRFYGGTIGNLLFPMAATNCLFHRLALTLDDGSFFSPFETQIRSSLFHGGRLDVHNYQAGSLWAFQNNLFDCTLVVTNTGTTNGYNAYTTNTSRLWPVTTGDILIATSNLTWQTGPLGTFYLPTNSPLVNAGSLTNAALAGLYHFTTFTNQVIEATNRLDISWHYPAGSGWGATFLPNDFDGDGTPDSLEDKNGNSVYDSGAGETDWKAYNSQFGIGSGPGLVVFTPLK